MGATRPASGKCAMLIHQIDAHRQHKSHANAVGGGFALTTDAGRVAPIRGRMAAHKGYFLTP